MAVTAHPWETDELMMGEKREREVERESRERSIEGLRTQIWTLPAAINHSTLDSVLSCLTQ